MASFHHRSSGSGLPVLVPVGWGHLPRWRRNQVDEM